MCRLMAYVGEPIVLERLLFDPHHSLIVQSYQPREMTAGLFNADGFGIGWYHLERPGTPFVYRHTLPIWNDANLPSLSRYIESTCFMANVRSATPGLSVDLNNCQPFQHGSILAIHNGYIDRFRKTLYRPIRNCFSDAVYQAIHGTTDSEHMFGLFLDALAQGYSLPTALRHTIDLLSALATDYHTDFSANLVITDGHQLVASRFASRTPVPTLYWLRDDPSLPNSILVASEPFFAGAWRPLGDRCLLTVTRDRSVEIEALV
jgi:glutamine amidotransferase